MADGCGRDSGCSDGSTCVQAFFDVLLGRNCFRALLFLLLSRQGIQVEKILLPMSADASLRKQESKRILAHVEQHLESILDMSRSYLGGK